MSETKFTPGPWFRDTQGDVAYGVTAKGNALIISWRGLSRPMSEEGQANSHLIAASPTMYEALKEARKAVSNAIEVIGSKPQDPEFETLRTIDSALSLARGETK